MPAEDGQSNAYEDISGDILVARATDLYRNSYYDLEIADLHRKVDLLMATIDT